MNILFVSDIPFNPIAGGLERVTDTLAKELIKRGHRVYYLCEKVGHINSPLLDYEFPAPLYQFPYIGRVENEKNIRFYKKLLSDHNIQVVINQRGLAGGYNDLLSITTTKVVSVLHSVPYAYVSRDLANIIKATVAPYVTLKKFLKILIYPVLYNFWKYRWINETKKSYLELAKYSDRCVTLSAKDKRTLQDVLADSDKQKVLHIPNPNILNRSEVLLESKENIVLYVGRLAKLEKAPLRLLKVWKYLHKKYSDWKLLVVGDGDEMERMQTYIRRNKLTNVILEGRKLDVAAYYKKATFICLTSNFEGWGMALTEGMQYGCIPLTFDNYGAATDIIDDGLNGCLIPAFNIKRYANRLSELMMDDLRRIEMAKSAIEKVELFSAEEVVNMWDELLGNL